MGVGNPFHQIEIEFTGAQYRKNPPKSIPFNFYNRNYVFSARYKKLTMSNS